jgi:hypothetical protein
MAQPSDLLAWAIGNSDTSKLEEDATRVQPKKFEQKWIDAIFDNSSIKRMKESLSMIVGSERDTTHEEKVEGLQKMEYYIEDLDNAAELHKIGALLPIYELAQMGNDEELQFHALEVLATCMQDLPSAKKDVETNTEYLNSMISILNAPTSSDRVMRSCLRGIAAFTSHQKTKQVQFIKLGGWLALSKLAGHSSPRVRSRIYIQIGVLMQVLIAVPSVHPTWQNIREALIRENDLEVLERAIAVLEQLKDIMKKGHPLLEQSVLTQLAGNLQSLSLDGDTDQRDSLLQDLNALLSQS